METIVSIIKVWGAQFLAILVAWGNIANSLEGIKLILGIISLLLAIGYGIWKWVADYKNNKKMKDIL